MWKASLIRLAVVILIAVAFLVSIAALVVTTAPRSYKHMKHITEDHRAFDTRETMSTHLNVDYKPFCTVNDEHVSRGLLMDSVILCGAMEDVGSSPYIHIENLPGDAFPNDWIAVNLDCTNFGKLKKDKHRQIICKTLQTYRELSQHFPIQNLHYTGFTSADRHDGTDNEYNLCLHLAGQSHAKGTKMVVEAWKNNPTWPQITIVVRDGFDVAKLVRNLLSGVEPGNIKIVDDFVSDSDLNKLASSHRIHICVSEYEGFGHSMNESRSTAALVLYTNAPCMDEKFEPFVTGIPVEVATIDSATNPYCTSFKVSAETIADSMNNVLSLSDEQRREIGQAARAQFIQDDHMFRERFIATINGNIRIPHIIHTIWISKDAQFEDISPPDKYTRYRNSWKEHNKDFQHEFWSGKRILDLISSQVPSYLKFYTDLSPVISKCDFARFVIVWLYGGVYVDMDFMCVKNVSQLLTGQNFFVREPREHEQNTSSPLLCNGIFAAIPRDPFVGEWIDTMRKNSGADILKRTGPKGLYQCYKKTRCKVMFGNVCDVLSILDTGETSAQCRGYLNSYTSTDWRENSGWAGPANKSRNLIDRDNPIDGQSMIWEDTPFTVNNYPGPDYDIAEKKTIFELALTNRPGFGVIDVGAHIGDLAVPLAQALKRSGREDVTVHAIDPSSAKCDFIHRMKLLNGLANLVVTNAGLTDVAHEFWHGSGSGKNTGGQVWERDKNDKKQTNTLIIDHSLAKQFCIADTEGCSQFHQAGILEQIFEQLGTTNHYFVEFGARRPRVLNSSFFRMQRGWKGLLLEGDPEGKCANCDGETKPDVEELLAMPDTASVTLRKAFVNAENINQLFTEHNVPASFDLLTIDIDKNEKWVMKALDTDLFSPRVVCLEFSSYFTIEESCDPPYDPNNQWDGKSVTNSSLRSLDDMMREKGYSYVTNVAGEHAIFAKNSELAPNDIGKQIPSVTPESWQYQVRLTDSSGYNRYEPSHFVCEKPEELDKAINKRFTNLHCSTSPHAAEHTQFVPVDSMIDYLGPIGLFHIDVEGHEIDVLNGARLLIQKYQPIILLEIWLDKGCTAKCKVEKECPSVYSALANLLPPYEVTDHLPNGDLICRPIGH